MFPPLSASREQGRNPTLVNNQMQNNIMNATCNQASNWSSLFQGGNVSTSDTSLQRFDLEMIEGVTQVPMDLRWKGLNDIERKKNSVKAIPIWLNIYNVPKDLWTGEGLGFLASRIGDPQRMDEATASRKRLLYVRVCVLVEIIAELPDSFKINMGGEHVRKISVEAYAQGDTPVETRVHTNEITSVTTNSIRNDSGAENREHNEAPVTTSQTEIDREERGVQIVECATEGTMNDMNLGTGGLNATGVDLNSPENTMGEDNATRVDARVETMINEEDPTLGLEEMNTIMERVENEVMAIVLATTAEVPKESANRQENE
ncbi:hypothetical protein IFM89_032732 [Coptis chinensis]|uniref:DUF4283 domain-containing protein n=1 Tax=Coptis chinensis TaxID=261450 RepID=A0A835HIR3_9MAGN|nr:hypothetical protein IFM89_032732 [Coptis chinensis]